MTNPTIVGTFAGLRVATNVILSLTASSYQTLCSVLVSLGTPDSDNISMFCAACNKTIKRGTYAFVVRFSRMNVKTAGRRDETAILCSARCMIQYGTDVEFDAIIQNDKSLETVDVDEEESD